MTRRPAPPDLCRDGRAPARGQRNSLHDAQREVRHRSVGPTVCRSRTPRHGGQMRMRRRRGECLGLDGTGTALVARCRYNTVRIRSTFCWRLHGASFWMANRFTRRMCSTRQACRARACSSPRRTTCDLLARALRFLQSICACRRRPRWQRGRRRGRTSLGAPVSRSTFHGVTQWPAVAPRTVHPVLLPRPLEQGAGICAATRTRWGPRGRSRPLRTHRSVPHGRSHPGVIDRSNRRKRTSWHINHQLCTSTGEDGDFLRRGAMKRVSLTLLWWRPPCPRQRVEAVRQRLDSIFCRALVWVDTLPRNHHGSCRAVAGGSFWIREPASESPGAPVDHPAFARHFPHLRSCRVVLLVGVLWRRRLRRNSRGL